MACTSWTASHNIIPPFHILGLKGHAKKCQNTHSVFYVYFEDEIINKIVSYTNVYISKSKTKYVREQDAKLTDTCEIKALLGIFFLARVMKSSRTLYY